MITHYMDSSFDLDTNMSNASPQGHNHGSITCHGCGKPGHIKRNCPENANLNQNRNTNQQQGRDNNGGRQNGQNNSNQNGNRNRNQNRNQYGNQNGGRNNRNRERVDPAKTSPKDLCYMHGERGGHPNRECSNPMNVHHPEHRDGSQNNRQQQSGQNTSNKPQINRHGNIRSNHGPLGNGGNYCERCNVRGHTAVTCQNPPAAFPVITCLYCKNKGHSHLECNHPLCCSKCREKGHSAESCRNLPADSTKFSWPASTYTRTQPFIQPQHVFQFPVQQSQPKGTTKAFFGSDFKAPAPLDDLHDELLQFKVQKEAERREAVSSKCWAAHRMYGHNLMNSEILEGNRFFSSLDPANPQINLPKNQTPTSALERLFTHFITFRPFGAAANLVANGWNFFRDPRALDAIAGCRVPVCNGCAKKGNILDATFEPIPVGADVLTVDDWDVWGVSIVFKCWCCKEAGYSFMEAANDKMDCC